MVIIRVKSHRARDKMKTALGYLPQGFYSFDFDGEFREVTPAEMEKLIPRSHRASTPPMAAMGTAEKISNDCFTE